MPFFKTTDNILKDNGEYFDSSWMNSNKLILPPSQRWDYKREMKIEDVDLWEVIYEVGTVGVYAAWHPHAEFYMIKPPYDWLEMGWGLETYYGKLAAERTYQRMLEFGVKIPTYSYWVENDDMWLYTSN